MGIDNLTTKPVAASVAAELASTLNLQDVGLLNSEYVQFREDDEHYYVDIGRSETITTLWQESYDRMKALDEKFNRTMLAILHELQTEELESTKSSDAQSAANVVALNAVTPSKVGHNKRPAPGSSSVNKVILYRAKRSTNEGNNQAANGSTNTGSTSSSSRGRKQLFESATKNKIKDVIDHGGQDGSVLKKTAKSKPFIAVEQSIEGGNNHRGNIVDASIASSNTSTSVVPRTRAQARLLASSSAQPAVKVQPIFQPISRVASSISSSATKTTRFRKAATEDQSNNVYSTPSRNGRQPKGGNFINKEDSTASKRNATPMRGGTVRNIIDLSSVSVTNDAGGRGKALMKPINTTPYKQGVSGSRSVSSIASSSAPGTPSSIASSLRRAEEERARQEKLLLSEDKRKKADEKKKDMLELRAQRLKEERDARMEKIRENKLALERQNKAKNKEVLCTASKPVVKPQPAATRGVNSARRRAILADSVAIPLSNIDLSVSSKPKTRAARNAVAAANTRAAQKIDSLGLVKKTTTAAVTKKEGSTIKNGRGKKGAATGANSKSTSSATVSGGKRKLFVDDDDDDGGSDVFDGVDKKKMPPPFLSTKPVATTLSPIASASGQPEGINTRINETFTTDEVHLLQQTIPSSSNTDPHVPETAISVNSKTAEPIVYLQDNPKSAYNNQTGWVFVNQATGEIVSPAPGTPAHSTFVAEMAAQKEADRVTFAVPAIPLGSGRVVTPKTTPKQTAGAGGNGNSSFNMAKKLLTPKGSGSGGNGKAAGNASVCTQYEMTPPPAPEPADNYDISRYIDSDDEEEQQRHEAAAPGKRIPPWATGKQFLAALHRQFRQTQEELATQTGRLFSEPLLPVPLDEMGLPVRDRYAVRSSSVNWKSAEVIRKAAAAANGKK